MGVMKKLLVLILVIGISSIYWFVSQGDQRPKVQKIPTRLAVSTDILKKVDSIGVIKPKVGAEVKVGSRVSGVVNRLLVDIGEYVEQGQLLAELDASTLATQMREAEALVQLAEAEFVYSRRQLDVANRNTFTTEVELDTLMRNVAVMEARHKQSLANLEFITIQHSYSKITAPMSGTIASVSTQQGETVAASFAAPTFLTIVDLQRLEIQAYVDESDIGQITLGAEVSFTVDTYAGAIFSGKVESIYPKAQIVNNVVNYIVIIGIERVTGYVLRPEMTAHIQFVIQKNEDTITIPRMALLREGGLDYVIVPDNDGWQKQQVKLGIINNSQIEILAGLQVGERYAIDKQFWLDSPALH